MSKDNKNDTRKNSTAASSQDNEKKARVEKQAALEKKRSEDIRERIATIKKYIPSDKFFDMDSLGNEEFIAVEATLTAQYNGDGETLIIFPGDTLVLDPGFLLPRKKLGRDGNEAVDKGRKNLICMVEFNEKLVMCIPRIEMQEGKPIVTIYSNLNFTDRSDMKIPADKGNLLGKLEFVIRPAEAK